MKKNLMKVLSLVLIMTIVLAGCGGGGGSSTTPPADGSSNASTPSGDSSTPATDGGTPSTDGGKDTIVVEISSDPPVLHAGFQANVTVNFVSGQCFDTLIVANADGSYSPNLATAWEFSDDGKDITFTIRDDVTFHNGEKLTVDDVVFSYNAIIAGAYADTSTSNMDRMEKIDDNTCKLVFKSVYGPALVCVSTGAMGIFPQAAYEADPDGFLRNPIGTGAYQFVSWKSGDSITYKRYENYHGGAAPIENLIFRVFTDSSVAAISLQSGEIDVLTNPLATDRNILLGDSNLQYDETESAMVTWGFFNCAPGSRFNDQRLREAISYAIDRESLMIGAMEGVAVPVNSMYPNFMPMAWPEYESRQYDPEKAKALLAECGYGPENPLKITFDGRETPHYKAPAEVLQAQLKDVGIEMELNLLEAGAWSNDVLRASNFEFNLICTTIGFLDFDERYALFVSGQPQNFYGVASPALDEAFNTNRNSSDEAVRIQACKDIIRIMDEECLIAPLYGNMRAICSNKDLKGVKADPGYRYQVKNWSW